MVDLCTEVYLKETRFLSTAAKYSSNKYVYWICANYKYFIPDGAFESTQRSSFESILRNIFQCILKCTLTAFMNSYSLDNPILSLLTIRHRVVLGLSVTFAFPKTLFSIQYCLISCSCYQFLVFTDCVAILFNYLQFYLLH